MITLSLYVDPGMSSFKDNTPLLCILVPSSPHLEHANLLEFFHVAQWSSVVAHRSLTHIAVVQIVALLYRSLHCLSSYHA